jgi:hypothetical protein
MLMFPKSVAFTNSELISSNISKISNTSNISKCSLSIVILVTLYIADHVPSALIPVGNIARKHISANGLGNNPESILWRDHDCK